MARQQRETEGYGENREREHAPARLRGKFRGPGREEGSPEERRQNKNPRQREFDEIAAEKTNWAVQGQKIQVSLARRAPINRRSVN